jgi:hypothetical protein
MKRAIAPLVLSLALLPGCRAYKEKKQWEAMAPAVAGCIPELRTIDGDLTRHMDDARAANATDKFLAMHKLRDVVKDHQNGKKSVDALRARIREVRDAKTYIPEISALDIAATRYSTETFCVSAVYVGELGLPQDKECLPKCESAWGKLVDASVDFRAAAKTAGFDVRAIRDR